MKCRYCGANMYEDDRDRHFKGNYDIYWCCEQCTGSCIEEYRFSQSYRELWHCENNGVVDETIKRTIDTTKGRYKQ